MVVLIGLASLVGWFFRTRWLIQPIWTFTPISYSAALGTVAFGLGMVGLGSGHRVALGIGGATAFLIGFTALMEAGTGMDLGLGLTHEAPALVELDRVFRLPLSSSLLLGFGGAAVLALVLPVRIERGRILAGAFGSIVAVLCVGIVVTRTVGVPDAGQGLLLGSSPALLLGSLLFGLDMAFVAWSADPASSATAPWVPISVGVACLLTVLLMWRSLIDTEVAQTAFQTAAAGRTVTREIGRQVQTAARTLSRLARFRPTPDPKSAAWVASMRTLTQDIDGMVGIAYTDRAATPIDYRPDPLPDDTANLHLQRRLAAAITASNGAAWQEISYVALGDSGKMFAAAVPVCDTSCTGHVVGVFDAQNLLRPVLINRNDGFSFRVTSEGFRLIGPRDARQVPSAWVATTGFSLGDVKWQVTVWPNSEGLVRLRSGLPEVLLLLGLTMAGLVPFTVRLAQMTLTRTRMAERVRLNQALETATDGIWEWAVPEGTAVRSDTLWRHLGYEPTQVPPEMEGWLSLIHPEDARRVRDALTDHLIGKRETFEAQYRVRDQAGEWHWLIDRGRVVERSPSGAPLRMLGISADVTARRRAEDSLREVQSLTTMGRLAARVAHEINNPLAGIQNAFTLIKDAVPADHPHRMYVGAIEREISRIAAVTRQLYETYRPDGSGSGEASLSSVVGDAVALLEQLNRTSQLTIAVDLSKAPPVVPLPDAVLRQAVYNLVQNAVEATPKAGTVEVAAAVEDDHFVLRVRDEGTGIPPEYRDRIFEPFFTTKPASVKTGGMGLGLSMVRNSVEAFGGTVEIRDREGGGTEFTIRLPLPQVATGVPV